jgi:DNA recombination protein RmuC
LNRAVKSFNSAVGSLETRLIPSAKKFNELGIGEESKIPDLNTVDITARELPIITTEK